MEAKKICRLLILVFLLLSLLFNFLYSTELKKRTVVSEDLVSGAISNLSSRGIQISADDIQRSMPERDIYYFELNEIDAYFDKVTNVLGESLFDNRVETAQFDTPDGYSIGYYDKNGSDKELGRVVFSESDLLFMFSKKGISMKDGDKPIENMQVDEISEENSGVIHSIISKLIYGSKLNYRITGSSSSDTFIIVTAVQTIDDNDISDAFINFVFQDNELVLLSGKWITEQPKARYHNTLLDGVNVLYKLNLENVKSINEQKVVYSLRKTDSNKYFIIPCWKITYADKNDNIVVSFFDAL